MDQHTTELAKTLLNTGFDQLSEREQRVIRRIAKRLHISRNTNREFDEQRRFGERLADRVAAFGGSWTFIILFGCVLVGWVVLNSAVLARYQNAFDPYPYVFLNLVLSMLAAIQAPVIMMSQNRQSAKDRLDAAHDFEVNLKAELEILQLHEKLDHIRDQQLTELCVMQQEHRRSLQLLLEKYNPEENRSGQTPD
ncbi:MAG: DUF1003 domain-containing protein [Gammaproteobacteria bacterium]